MSGPTALLTYDDVAARLAVSRRTVERLVALGRIRTVRVGDRSRRVEERELAAYIAAQRNAA